MRTQARTGGIVKQTSGLVRKRHRRGQRRRNKLRLALRVLVSLVSLAIAAALSAGIIHIVERPVPPIEALADKLPAPALAVDPPEPTNPTESN